MTDEPTRYTWWPDSGTDDAQGVADWREKRADCEARMDRAMQWGSRFIPEYWRSETVAALTELAALANAQIASIKRSVHD